MHCDRVRIITVCFIFHNVLHLVVSNKSSPLLVFSSYDEIKQWAIENCSDGGCPTVLLQEDPSKPATKIEISINKENSNELSDSETVIGQVHGRYANGLRSTYGSSNGAAASGSSNGAAASGSSNGAAASGSSGWGLASGGGLGLASGGGWGLASGGGWGLASGGGWGLASGGGWGLGSLLVPLNYGRKLSKRTSNILSTVNDINLKGFESLSDKYRNLQRDVEARAYAAPGGAYLGPLVSNVNKVGSVVDNANRNIVKGAHTGIGTVLDLNQITLKAIKPYVKPASQSKKFQSGEYQQLPSTIPDTEYDSDLFDEDGKKLN